MSLVIFKVKQFIDTVFTSTFPVFAISPYFFTPVAQLERALDYGSRCWEFKSSPECQFAGVAQLVRARA